jgi:hypothetical protein
MLARFGRALLCSSFLGTPSTSSTTNAWFQIDVRDASDVKKALAFSLATGVRLSIKNSGHDYKGRSSGRDTLSLWVGLIFFGG